MKEIEIIKPDDWHAHFRDGEILKAVLPETTRNFARSIVMPNLVPPILNGKDALEYKKRINQAIPNGEYFKPLMTVYLTENTNKNELKDSYKKGLIFAVKLYPAGATTNSDSGVKDLSKVMPILNVMADIGIPLLIHGEVTNPEIDIYDREKVFIEEKLNFIVKELPNLKITLEHITTNDAVNFIREANNNLCASITPHHLTLNRNAMLVGGIKPHHYCLPLIKRETHRKALLDVATSGNSKFFLGTDTAPHLKSDKENACGCAGIFNSKYCLSILAELFDRENSLMNLESFVSINGAKHYECNLNKEKITLQKLSEPIQFQDSLKFQDKEIKIFKPDFEVFWEVK